MERRTPKWDRVLVFILAGITFTCHRPALGSGESKAGLPLIFDPQTNKYFIGGNAKFILKKEGEGGMVDRIEVSLDGGDYKRYGDAIEFKSEGKHTLKFRAVNPVNNWSPVQFTEVFVDLTPPTTEARLPTTAFHDATGTYLPLKSIISLSAQDNLSGVAAIEYSWHGKEFLPYTKAISVDEPGPQTLTFRSTDLVGNKEGVKSIEFFVDALPPVSTLKLSAEGKPITVKGKPYLGVSDAVSFTLEAKDDASKVKQILVSMDDRAAVPYLRPLYFLKEGPHRLTYFAEDNVGNREEPKTVNLFTVSVPPMTSAVPAGRVVNTGGINFATPGFELRLEAKDNAVGLERIEYRVDDAPDMKGYLEPIRLKQAGPHTIYFHAIDRAGNQEPLKTYSVRVFETSPETRLTTAQPLVERDGVTYSPSPNVITLNVGKSEVGIAQTLYSLDDGAYAVYQAPLTLGADRKVHKLSYKSVDKLGNEETPKTAVFHMIGTTPSVDLFISNGENAEEQIRTRYFDQPGGKPASPRAPASAPKRK